MWQMTLTIYEFILKKTVIYSVLSWPSIHFRIRDFDLLSDGRPSELSRTEGKIPIKSLEDVPITVNKVLS